MSIIIRRYIDHMKFAAYMTVSFITFFHIPLVPFCITLYMVACFVCFCLFLKIIYSYFYVMYSYCYVMYLFVSLSILIVMYVPSWVFSLIVLFCALFVCKRVLYYCHRVSTQLQLTNISYHIISYHISHHIISYHISYQIIPYRITSHHITSYHILSYHITSYHHIVSYHTKYQFRSHITWNLKNSYYKDLQKKSVNEQKLWKVNPDFMNGRYEIL